LAFEIDKGSSVLKAPQKLGAFCYVA